jgi:hypothetical protein
METFGHSFFGDAVHAKSKVSQRRLKVMPDFLLSFERQAGEDRNCHTKAKPEKC